MMILSTRKEEETEPFRRDKYLNKFYKPNKSVNKNSMIMEIWVERNSINK